MREIFSASPVRARSSQRLQFARDLRLPLLPGISPARARPASPALATCLSCTRNLSPCARDLPLLRSQPASPALATYLPARATCLSCGRDLPPSCQVSCQVRERYLPRCARSSPRLQFARDPLSVSSLRATCDCLSCQVSLLRARDLPLLRSQPASPALATYLPARATCLSCGRDLPPSCQVRERINRYLTRCTSPVRTTCFSRARPVSCARPASPARTRPQNIANKNKERERE